MASKWVEVTHPKTKGTATVAASAVPQLKKSGWALKTKAEKSAEKKEG